MENTEYLPACLAASRDVTEPAKICIRQMRIWYEKADLSPDQNLLVPVIIATAIQLSS